MSNTFAERCVVVGLLGAFAIVAGSAFAASVAFLVSV